MEETYFRRGFGLKSRVQPLIDLEYHSTLVQDIRSGGHRNFRGSYGPLYDLVTVAVLPGRTNNRLITPAKVPYRAATEDTHVLRVTRREDS